MICGVERIQGERNGSQCIPSTLKMSKGVQHGISEEETYESDGMNTLQVCIRIQMNGKWGGSEWNMFGENEMNFIEHILGLHGME